VLDCSVRVRTTVLFHDQDASFLTASPDLQQLADLVESVIEDKTYLSLYMSIYVSSWNACCR
jgi:hypothetical protein